MKKKRKPEEFQRMKCTENRCTTPCSQREYDIQNERRRIARAILRVEESVSDRRALLTNFLFFVCVPVVILCFLYAWWRESGFSAVGVLLCIFALATLYLLGVYLAFLIMTYPTRKRLRRKRSALSYWRREAARLDEIAAMQRLCRSKREGAEAQKKEE